MFDDNVTHEILRIFRSVYEENEGTELDLETDILALELSIDDYNEIINDLENEFMCGLGDEIETIGDIAKIVMEHGFY